VRYYALYLVVHPWPTEPVSSPRSWRKLTFLYWRAVKQSINQSIGFMPLYFSLAILDLLSMFPSVGNSHPRVDVLLSSIQTILNIWNGVLPESPRVNGFCIFVRFLQSLCQKLKETLARKNTRIFWFDSAENNIYKNVFNTLHHKNINDQRVVWMMNCF